MRGTANYGVTGAFCLHIVFVALSQDNDALACILARSPYPVVLMSSDGLREAVLWPEEVDGAGVSIVIGKDRGFSLLFRGKRAVVGRNGLSDLLPAEHIGVKLRQDSLLIVFELLLLDA